MFEWNESILGEYLTFKNGRTSPNRIESGRVPVFGSNGVIGYSDEINSPPKSLIIGRVGSYCGSVYHSDTDCWVTDNAIIGLPNEKDESEFWYYVLSLLNLNNYRSGSGQPLLNQRTLNSISVSVPESASIRSRIGHFLMSFDRKIQINHEINQTLESIAQTIFKSWFVDFDPVKAKMEDREPEGMDAETAALFPDRLVESELGMIPEGWEVSTIESLADTVAMGPFGSNIKVSTFVHDGIPVISGKHLNNTMLEDVDYNYITVEHADKLSRSNVYRGDIVFTHAGNIGQVSYVPLGSQYERYILSQRQFYLRPNTRKTCSLYMVYYFRSLIGQHELLANTSQVGVPSISRPVSNLKRITLVNPVMSVLTRFIKIVDPLHSMMTNTIKESETLAAIRDTLLPKLISGEIQIPKDWNGQKL